MVAIARCKVAACLFCKVFLDRSRRLLFKDGPLLVSGVAVITSPYMKKSIFALVALFAVCSQTFAMTITSATGGNAISADTASTAPSPGWTALGPIVLDERVNGQKGNFAVGSDVTLILKAPTGFEFNTNVTPNITYSLGADISAASVTVSDASTITATLTVGGTAAIDRLTIGNVINIQVRPTGTSPLVAGNIYRPSTGGGTASITGLNSTANANGSGGSNLGTLTEVGGAPVSIAIVTEPSSNAVAGVAFAQQPVVQTKDQFGNVCTADNTTIVTASRNAGAGTLLGATNMTAVNGTVTFTNLAASVASTITIDFTSGSLTPATSASIVVDPAPPAPSALVISIQPSASATAGVAFAQQPVVLVYDQYGAPYTNDNATVVIASVLDGVGVLQGTTSNTVVGGVAAFTDLSHNLATNITIQFSAVGLSNTVSTTIAVSPNSADRLVFASQPGTAFAGVPFYSQPVVKTTDQFGNNSTVGLGANVDVTMSLAVGAGPLSGTTTMDIGTAVGNGLVTFTNLTLAAVDGTNQLTATAGGLLPANSDFFAVAPVTASRLVVSIQPSTNAVAGAAFAEQPVVRVEDSFGNLVADSTALVTVSRGAGVGSVLGTTTVAAVGGVVTFADLYLTNAGTADLVFTSLGLSNAVSGSIVVTPATASALVFTTQPAGGHSGSAFATQPVVQARDQFGNNSSVGLASNQVVSLALTAGSGSLIGTTTADISGGTAVFADVGVSAAGLNKQITASSTNLTDAVSATFTVGGIEPALVNVSADTAVSGFTTMTGPTYYESLSGDVGVGTIILNAPAGYEFDTGGSAPTVRIQKIAGGGNTGNINQGSGTPLSGGNNNAVWPVTSVNATQVVFTVVSPSVGVADSLTWQNVRIRALSGNPLASGTITKTGTSVMAAVVDGVTSFASLQTVAGAVNHLVISTQPSTTASAGFVFGQQPVIRLEDQFNNIVSNSTATITAVINQGTSTLQGTTAIAASGGYAAFTDLSYNVAETITINFTTGALTAVTSDPVVVSSGNADRLAFVTQPAGAVAGFAFGVQPVIKTQDQYGNNTSAGLADHLTLTVALTSGSGILSGTTSIDIGTAAGNGTAAFTDLSIDTAGVGNQLTASVSGLTSATSAVFNAILPPDHVELVTGDNQTAAVGTVLPTNPAVLVVDANTNGVANVAVSFNVVSGGGSVGSATVLTDSNGLASTSFTLGSTPGVSNNVLVASAATVGTPSNITFYASADIGAAARLTITTQPSTNAVAGVALAQQPVVQVEDAFGNLVTDSTASVTVSRGAGIGSVLGTTTVSAVGGVVTFADLYLTNAGTADLVFTSLGLSNAVSGSIVVTPATASALVFTTQPAGGHSGSAFATQPVVQARDQFGNNSSVGLASNQVVSLALTAGSGSLIGTTTADISGGTAVFADVGVSAAGLNKQITASSTNLTDAVSATFTVGGIEPALVNVSADTAVSGFTTMTGPTYYESLSGDVGVGTIILNAPAGYEFDTGGSAPTVRIQKIAGGGNTGNINQGSGTPLSGGNNNAVWPVTSVNATQVVFTVVSPSVGVADSLTWQNVRIRALSGNPLASGTITKTGTSVTAAVVDGVTGFASLQTVAGAINHLVISTQPSSTASAGIAFAQQPVIRLEDQFNNIVSNSTATITAAINQGTSTLQGTTTIAASGGYAAFTNVSYNVAETITINFTTGALTPVTSDAIVVGGGIADRLVFFVQPAGAVVNFPFGIQPVVKSQDQFGNYSSIGLPTNLDVTISLSTGPGSLSGTTVVDIGSAAGNGTAIFTNLQIDTAGLGDQLTAAAVGLTSATSAVFNVTTADHLEYISGDGLAAVVGTTLASNPTVRVVDTNGAPVEGVAVYFTVQSGGGSVGEAIVLTDTNGLASTTYTIGSSAGTSNNVMTASALLPGSPTTITFYASAVNGSAAQLGIQAQPSAIAIAGEVFAQQPQVRIEDAFGNLVSSDNTTVVTARTGTGTGALQGVLTATAVDGVATFTNLSYNVAETITLAFSAASLSGTNSTTIVVSAATVSQLAFTTQPGNGRTDSLLDPQPVVKTQDQFGNNSTNGLVANLVVNVALTAGTGSLLGTTNFDIGTAAGNGVVTFTNLQVTAGGIDKQLTATANGLTNAISSIFRVGGVDPAIAPIIPGDASFVDITGPAYYEIASGDVGVGTLTLNAPAGFEFDTGGTAPTVSIQRIGGNGGPQNNINGASNSGNTEAATTVSSTQITLTISNSTTNGVVNSLIWQNIRVRAVGLPFGVSNITKTGSSSVAAVTGTTSWGTLIGAARPAELVIQTQPSSLATAGVAFTQQPVILVKDQYGVLWTSNSVSVTAGIASGTGVLNGALTQNSVNGVVAFTNLSYDVAETITLSFSGNLLIGVTSSNIVVGPNNVSQLAFTTQPAGATVGAIFATQPLIQTRDQFGNTSVLGLPANLNVTVSLASGTGSLLGNVTANIGTSGGNGTVTFTNLQINSAGDKQLVANASGLTGATSQVFNVAKANQTITFAALGAKTFGDAPFTVSATASSGLPVTFSIVSGPATVSGDIVTITGAGSVTVRASQAGDADYNAAASVDQTFTVNKADQTVTFSPVGTKEIGDTFQLSATASSGLTVTYSIVSGSATLNGDMLTITGSGTVVVRASQAGDTNYNAASADISIFVKSVQTITFGPIVDKIYGDTFTPSATASSGLPVTVSVVSGPATVTNNVVTVVGIGSITLQASQAGNTNYSAATNVQATFNATVASLIVTADSTNKFENDPNPTLTGSITGLKNNDNITATFSTTATISSGVGTYPITFTLNDPNGRLVNYTVTTNLGTLTVQPMAAPVITVNPVSQTVRQGGNVRFTVQAVGGSLNYQWRFNGVPVSGATTTALQLNHVHKNQRGVYRCWVTNTSGIALSTVVSLTVRDIPADFDENGSSDIAFQNVDGRLAAWMMRSNQFWYSSPLAGTNLVPAGWSMIAQGDFTGEGHADLLFQHSDRRVMVWVMTNRTFISQTMLLGGAPVSNGWHAVAAADLNRNYQTDILFQNDDGRLQAILMYRTTASRTVTLNDGQPVEAGWKAIAMRDMNSDGKADILFQHPNGGIAAWLMNDTVVASKVTLRSGPAATTGWKIVGIADINGDGKNDLIWFNSNTGASTVWVMNDTQYVTGVPLRYGATMPPGWTMVGPK